MDYTTSQTDSGGVGFTGLLTVAFIVFKLTHVIDWSWWWVLAPTWIPVVGSLGVCAFALTMYAIGRMLADRPRVRR